MRKQISTAKLKSALEAYFSWEIQIPISWFFLKGICKTVLVNSGVFLLIVRALSRPLFLKTVFQILLRIFQKDSLQSKFKR